jgi:hypothetical protein
MPHCTRHACDILLDPRPEGRRAGDGNIAQVIVSTAPQPAVGDTAMPPHAAFLGLICRIN